MKTTLDEFTAAIRQVTTVYRKGPVVEQRPGVTEVWGYPHGLGSPGVRSTLVRRILPGGCDNDLCIDGPDSSTA